MADLEGLRVAILATDLVEEAELVEPRKALIQAGATTELIAPKTKAGDTIQGVNHADKAGTHKIDVPLGQADPNDYDALFLPGGAQNADVLRMDADAQSFARAFDADGRPIAVICHGPWLLVSAGLVRERRLTSYYTLQDDIRNAGGYWADAPVIRDINWVSSRHPGDIPQFSKAFISLLTDMSNNGALTILEAEEGEREP